MMTQVRLVGAPPAFRSRWAPAPRRHAHFLGTPARLGQDSLGLSVVTAGVVGLAFSAASAYAGIYTGTHAPGVGSVVGWVVGVIGILSGVGTVLMLAGAAILGESL